MISVVNQKMNHLKRLHLRVYLNNIWLEYKMNQSPNSNYKDKEPGLIKLLRQGNAEGFEEIFKLYWKDLYRHAYTKLRNKEEAEEIVQEVFTTLWAKRNELLITNLTYYLHTAVKNKVLNNIRSQSVHKRYWDYYKQFFKTETTATEESVYYNDLKIALDNGISHLSEKTKSIFLLSRDKGYSAAEIAKKLNLSKKTVEYHLTRSIKQLKVHLKDFLP
jgi:RNA polymerase sigma-70 factor (family 1)